MKVDAPDQRDHAVNTSCVVYSSRRQIHLQYPLQLEGILVQVELVSGAFAAYDLIHDGLVNENICREKADNLLICLFVS